MENQKSPSKKAFIVTVVLLLIGVSFVILNLLGKNTSGNTIQNNILTPSSNNEIQKISLSMNGNYYPNTIKVKSGVPVEISLDSSVKGCYRAFSIPGLGISNYLAASSDTISFTPKNKGIFKFQCSMGMGTGTIIVE